MTLHRAPLPVECLRVYCGTAPLPPLQHRNMDLMVLGAISAWLRHTPRNGKPLFSMDLALLEAGYKEAQHIREWTPLQFFAQTKNHRSTQW